MRRIESLFLEIVFLLVAHVAAATSDWTLAKSAEGIEVYTRPVAGSGVEEFKGVAEVGGDVDSILAVLRDSARFKDWFPNTTESRLLSRDGTVSYQYSVMGAPWPIAERDNVIRSELVRDASTGVVEIGVEAAPEYYPQQEGRVRVRKAKGMWTLEPVGPRRTRITFRMHLEPGGGIPDWLINSRVVNSPFETLRNLRAVLSR